MTTALTTLFWLVNVLVGLVIIAAAYVMFDALYDKWQDAQDRAAERHRSVIRQFGKALENKKGHPLLVRFIEAAGGQVIIRMTDIEQPKHANILVSEDPNSRTITFTVQDRSGWPWSPEPRP